MARSTTPFVCTACGHQEPKWLGRCPACRAWGSLEPEAPATPQRPALGPPGRRAVRLEDVPLEEGGQVRLRTGINELDQVLGGGLVAGSLVLLGGDPGVGKSTLLLSAVHHLARRGLPVLYVTGEESPRQVRLRAERLGTLQGSVHLLATVDFEETERAVREVGPAVLVVDSVQTQALSEVAGIPGSVSQVREVAHRAMLLAKGTGTAVVLVGHITRSGDLAGPKMLEHLVDAVLHFEGDGRSALRVLRSVKNRFGAAGELGLFEMVEDGLREVPDASARLLQERLPDAAGTAVVVAMEGNRPLLAEVQALVGPPTPSVPARTTVGVDRARVLMVSAVLQKSGYPLHDRDVFVNAAGGIRLIEPAGDLAMAAAIASSLRDKPLPPDTAIFGEIGLVGEVRACSHPALRLREAARRGFRRVLLPATAQVDAAPGVELLAVRTVREALEALGRARGRP